MLGLFGVLFILAGGATLAMSTTMFGQLAGLILWVIAALFVVGQVVVSAIEREARGLGKALAMHATATTKPSSPSTPSSTPPAPAEKKGLWAWLQGN